MPEFVNRKIQPIKIFFILMTAAVMSLSMSLIASAASFDSNETRIQNLINEFQHLEKKAEILSEQEILGQKIALIFEGENNQKTVDGIIEILKEYDIPGSFYLTGISVSENPESVQNIIQSGFEIGNYAANDSTAIDNQSIEKIARTIFSSQRAFEASINLLPATARVNSFTYPEKLLKIAKACGIDNIIKPSAFLNYRSFSTKEDTEGYVRHTTWGTILAIKIDQELGETEYVDQVKDLDEKPAVDPEPSVELDQPNVPAEDPISEDQEEKLLRVVTWLIQSYLEAGFEFVTPQEINNLADPELSADFGAQRSETPALSEIFETAYTTQRAVAITFNNLTGGNEEEIYALLDNLDRFNIQATFFITGLEAFEQKPLIREIIQRGHQVETAGFTGSISKDDDYNIVYKEILKGTKTLFQEFGITPRFLRFTVSNTSATVREAAKNLNLVLTSYDKNPPIYDDATVDQTMEYFSSGFHRGNILHFNLAKSAFLTELLEKIAWQVRDTGYDFTTIPVLYDEQYEKIPLVEIEGWDAIRMNLEFDPNAAVHDYYEVIGTSEKTRFITFDDWAGDRMITHILDTLERYNVKATFFIRAAGAENNPNLVRAIAEAGHDVACHTYSHEASYVFLDAKSMQEDAIRCYQVLTEAIGRQPTLFFRFPRHEVSKTAINAILATGYTSIVQGAIRPPDYECSKDCVIRTIYKDEKNYYRNGEVLILHILDNATGGAALPQIIEHYRARGYKLSKVSDFIPAH